MLRRKKRSQKLRLSLDQRTQIIAAMKWNGPPTGAARSSLRIINDILYVRLLIGAVNLIGPVVDLLNYISKIEIVLINPVRGSLHDAPVHGRRLHRARGGDQTSSLYTTSLTVILSLVTFQSIISSAMVKGPS